MCLMCMHRACTKVLIPNGLIFLRLILADLLQTRTLRPILVFPAHRVALGSRLRLTLDVMASAFMLVVLIAFQYLRHNLVRPLRK